MNNKPIAAWSDAVFNGALPAPGKQYNPAYKGANFRGADLSGSSMVNLDLSGCDFSGALLVETDFRGSILHGAKFDGAVLDGALFANADSQEAIKQWEKASGKKYSALSYLFDMSNA